MPLTGNIYYFENKTERWGKTCLVLIHGAGGTHLHWPHTLRRLPNYKVFAPDLPGHGKSLGLGEQTIENYARCIINWMDEIGLYQAVFVGHSMGGAIAQQLALDHADRVKGLVLVSTGAYLPVSQDLLEKLSIKETFENAIELIIQWSYPPGADQKLIDQGREKLLETRPSVLHGDFLACNNFDQRDKIGQISKPVLVVCGEEDKMTPVKFGQFLASNLSNANLETIPDAGHMVMLEFPEAVTKKIVSFIKQV